MTAIIKDFYLATSLDMPEYMQINVKLIKLNIQKRYNMKYTVKGCVIMKINNTAHRLP